MKEQVGICAKCKKTIYCMDGFLNGIIDEENILYCFSCLHVPDEVFEE
jgi:hypothetical protein